MTDLQKKFLDLAKEYENQVDSLKEVSNRLQVVMLEMGVDQFVQDSETKIVYQTTKPNGVFVYYKVIDYIRTKKENERAGSLSVKKAEEAGFTL